MGTLLPTIPHRLGVVGECKVMSSILGLGASSLHCAGDLPRLTLDRKSDRSNRSEKSIIRVAPQCTGRAVVLVLSSKKFLLGYVRTYMYIYIHMYLHVYIIKEEMTPDKVDICE